MRVLALLLCLAAVAHAQTLSPRARLVLSGRLPPSSISDGRDDRALLAVRIPGGADTLRAAGLEASPLVGELAWLRATRRDLERLATLPGLISVEERRLLQVQLDAAAPQVHAPEARAETGLDGRGVLVGVVDTGADFRHADLRGSDGRTRIEALIDFGAASDTRHPELGDLDGAVWLRDELDAALAAEASMQTAAVPIASSDSNGHGTHVAGIAAANGLATGRGFPSGRYLGIAPAADLVIAKATRGSGGGFTDVDVLSAARFIAARATALGRPLVLNLSLGGAGGPHDGTTPLEAGLDALFPLDAPGRALVVAAGNEGARDVHAAGWLLDGEVTIPIEVGEAAGARGDIAVEVWTDRPVTLSAFAPSGSGTDAVAPSGTGDATTRQGRILVENFSRSGTRPDRRQNAIVVFTGSAPPGAGTWQIRLRGTTARWDLWITETPGNAPIARFSEHVAVDDRLNLPGTARSAITVGSVVSRTSWVDLDGKTNMRDLTVGAPSLFTATGPTFDGRFAPDLVAPGEFIASSLSADTSPEQVTSAFFAGPANPHLAWADDGVHGLLRGTSQAAPVVAGAAALLLQADPTLTPQSVREILRVTASGAGGFSPRLGFGRLDVLAAARLATGRRGTTVDRTRSSVGVSRDALPPGDQLTIVTVTPRSSDGAPLGSGRAVTIESTAGTPLGPVVDFGWGRYERSFAAHAARGQVAQITATVDGVELSSRPEVFFVADRSEIGRPFVAAAGCAVGGAGSSLFLLALVGATLFVVRRTNRRGRSPCDPRTPRL